MNANSSITTIYPMRNENEYYINIPLQPRRLAVLLPKKVMFHPLFLFKKQKTPTEDDISQ